MQVRKVISMNRNENNREIHIFHDGAVNKGTHKKNPFMLISIKKKVTNKSKITCIAYDREGGILLTTSLELTLQCG